ncbi:SPOR domain-containing protein [Alcanivorax sp. JB21]|uniref:SPOR domain-containing protein n=1 Tax=Alcanivorax limicola TaxID=2874102 RepID=UPI001CBBD253|nr:SPOR domain-containing protein [Alcanivorax limicola]MBZ2190587.1 SPOR domain-containing protein [Alcanivorax limicola]
MRWVFYSLLILNIVYLGWNLLSHVAPVSVPVSAPVSAPQTLQLLGEARLPGASRADQAGVTERTGGAGAASTAGVRLCEVVGPWPDRQRAEQVRSELGALARTGRIHAVPVRRDRLSWVYLPAQPRREDALAALRELQARGVDSFIVSEGEDANAVSLGYFSSEESARGLKVKMRNAGYPAEVRETWREALEYWIYLDAQPDEALDRLIAAVGGLPEALAEPGSGVDRAACR